MSDTADAIWRDLARLVLDNKDSWRRAVVERSGLPFSRVRILRRLARASMTVKQVAEAATIDAPAATVAVNDLVQRGLVIREVNAENRRCKQVSLTDSGRAMVATIEAIADPAPSALRELSAEDLAALRAVLDRIRG